MFRSGNAAGARGEVARHNLGRSGGPGKVGSGIPALYPFRLSFYERPPLEEVTIEQFEAWALDRLRGKLISTGYCSMRKLERLISGWLSRVVLDNQFWPISRRY
jgi:hypothetical protein